MNIIYLRGEVERAVNGAWSHFSQEHPHLANVLDREVLIEEATHALRDDPEFAAALANAKAAGWAGGLAAEFVQRFVVSWLRRLS